MDADGHQIPQEENMSRIKKKKKWKEKEKEKGEKKEWQN